MITTATTLATVNATQPQAIELPSGAIKIMRHLLADGDSNTKLRKSSGAGFATVGLSMAPHKSAGVGNTCPHASAGCVAACLNHQGRAAFWTAILEARQARTLAYYHHREWFIARLRLELSRKLASAERQGLRLACRLNVFSDIAWEESGIIDDFPSIEFYDYSKNPKRAGLLRPNYWVTFSRSETNHADCLDVLASGANVAIAFDTGRTGNRVSMDANGADLPKTWRGYRVIDGDTTDLRFDDPRGRKRGIVVGLRLKAASRAERDGAIASGFAIV